MTKLTLDEIIELLEKADLEPASLEDRFNLDYALKYSTDEEKESLEKIGEIKLVASGLQDDYNAYVIQHFVDHDVYMKLTAEYDSYESVQHFQEWGKEVKPREAKVIIYD